MAKVTRVHDGDTVTLSIDGRSVRARLIGIDAPEMGQEPWGKMSRTYLKGLIREIKGRVFIETDIVPYDKYDRLLVYLWTPDRRNMLNERMIRDGYAVLFTLQPNSRYAGRFVQALESAKKSGAGIWGPEGLKELPRDYKKAHPRK
ncbi:MAG: thermonuclease family protein [Nitrospirota bacterium]|nr:thermonuclease family protein [Nitrospirota bacterium]